MFRITFKIKSTLLWSKVYVFSKFHENSHNFLSHPAIKQPDRQTDGRRQTDKQWWKQYSVLKWQM